MSETSNWHEFYEPYIPVRSIFRTDTIVDKYIKIILKSLKNSLRFTKPKANTNEQVNL